MRPLRHELDQVRDFHEAFGSPVRYTPTRELTAEERKLRVELVVEEALEFAEAMGVTVFSPNTGSAVTSKGFDLIASWDQGIDLVEAADALADSLYVVYGSALTLGIPIREVFAEVHRSNMAKLGPDGKPTLRLDGRVLKPETWTPPDIEGVMYKEP